MSMSKKLLFFLVLNLLYGRLDAEIVLDGSLGGPGALKGPDYQIDAHLGQQQGTNLFHSFSEFNLDSHESATFTGPESITHLLARVTGGHPSRIDGLFKSDLPQADIYFLNPTGMVFGPHARLDVPGSFYASTAHSLRLREGGRFDALQPHNSLLTSAPVEAFGFLEKPVAPITVESSSLAVLPGQTFSLIGGNLDLQAGSTSLKASMGQIQLISVKSSGEVMTTEAGTIDVSSFKQLGEIKLLNNSFIDVSGPGSGRVVIRSGQFFAENSRIYAKTLGGESGQEIDIQSNEIALTQGSEINANVEGAGHGADIHLQAQGDVVLAGKNAQKEGSKLLIKTKQGHAGQIEVIAKNIILQDGAMISGETSGSGPGGSITLKAMESIRLVGDGTAPLTEVRARTLSQENKAGPAGNVVFEAKNIVLQDGAILDITTHGQGHSGNINLKASEAIIFTGTGGSAENASKLKAYAHMDSNGGQAGNVILEAGEILLADGAYINASTFSSGDAGTITLRATGRITLTGARGEGWGTWVGSGSHARKEEAKAGKGGSVFVQAKELVIREGGSIGSSSAAGKGMQSSQAGNVVIRVSGPIYLSGVNPYGETEDGFGSGLYVQTRGAQAGGAGTLDIEAESLTLDEGAVISSSTSSSAPGGNIKIKVHDFIHVHGSSASAKLAEPGPIQKEYQKSFEDYSQKVSTSGIYAASSGTGESGEITIEAKSVYLLDGGTISASTQNAGGGQIISNIPFLLYLQQGQIITSVHGGKGNGGDIISIHPIFVVLNQSQIKAQADAGHGGNIRLIANHYISSYESIISASSRVGMDGKVMIIAPNEGPSGGLYSLPENKADAGTFLKKPCWALSFEEFEHRSRFSLIPIVGSSQSPGDLKSSSSPMLLGKTAIDRDHDSLNSIGREKLSGLTPLTQPCAWSLNNS